MEILSILVALFIIWAVLKKGFQLLGAILELIEGPVGYALWGVIIFVVLYWLF